jgi:hypothetical protein
MVNKSQFTKRRNWTKLRLSGMQIDTSCLTNEEKEKWQKCKYLIHELIDNFEENSSKFGLNVVRYKITHRNAVSKSSVIYRTKKELKLYKGDPDYKIEEIKYTKDEKGNIQTLQGKLLQDYRNSIS